MIDKELSKLLNGSSTLYDNLREFPWHRPIHIVSFEVIDGRLISVHVLRKVFKKAIHMDTADYPDDLKFLASVCKYSSETIDETSELSPDTVPSWTNLERVIFIQGAYRLQPESLRTLLHGFRFKTTSLVINLPYNLTQRLRPDPILRKAVSNYFENDYPVQKQKFNFVASHGFCMTLKLIQAIGIDKFESDMLVHKNFGLASPLHGITAQYCGTFSSQFFKMEQQISSGRRTEMSDVSFPELQDRYIASEGLSWDQLRIMICNYHEPIPSSNQFFKLIQSLLDLGVLIRNGKKKDIRRCRYHVNRCFSTIGDNLLDNFKTSASLLGEVWKLSKHTAEPKDEEIYECLVSVRKPTSRPNKFRYIN